MGRDRILRLADMAVVGSLMLMAGTLPFADITVFRDIGLVSGLFFWIVTMVLRKQVNWFRTPLDLPFLLLFITGLISLATAVDFKYSLSEIRGEMLKGMLLFYLAVVNVRDGKRAMYIVGSMLAGAVVMDTYTLIHYFLYGELGAGESGLHCNAPELGTFLVQAAPFIFFGLLSVRDKRWRLGWGLMVLLHLGATYVTFSRMCAMAVIFEIVLVVFFWTGSWKITLAVLVGCSILFQVTAPSPVIVLDREKAELSSTEVGGVILSGEGNRLAAWKEMARYLARHPFEGIGYGRHSFKKKFPEMKKLNSRLWHAHNVFINTALELGIQGLVVLLFLLYRVFTFLWPGIRNASSRWWGDPGNIIIASAFVSTAGLFFRNMTDDIYNNDAALLAWLIIGTAFSIKTYALSAKANETPAKKAAG